MGLTHELVAHLRRPFTPEAVGFRADAKSADRAGRVRCVVYIDARLARERLSDVDPNWTAQYALEASYTGDPLGLQWYLPVRCDLTVCGVTRSGVGQAAVKAASANIVKAAHSDALKRAAVEFHIGAYLYAMRQFFAKEEHCWIDQGKVKSLNREAVVDLRKQYAAMIAHPAFGKRFGEPTEYGSIQDDERGTIPTEDGETPAALFVEKPARAPVRVKKVTGK